MYSYEERMRAVELYIKLGKRVRATIRELGYPTKNALNGWHREYERRQDLPICSVPRLPKFSAAQRRVALEHYAGQGRCISWTLRALGYPGLKPAAHGAALVIHLVSKLDALGACPLCIPTPQRILG